MLSKKLDHIVQLFEEIGILRWVISPGSRNAPIVAALLRNPNMQLFSMPDERSAAFSAMGMAQSDQFPAAFLCTSGSALVNAFPAVVEAYYQRIPLCIVSADRPEELIDQWDGQTLRQPGIFGTYVRHSHHCNPRNSSEHELTEGIYQLFQDSFTQIPGPFHLNIALSEPIYEGISTFSSASDSDSIAVKPFVYKASQIPKVTLEDISSAVGSAQKIAVLVGQNPPSETLSQVLSELQNYLPIFSDVCSSQQPYGLQSWDWALLKREIPESLKPDLLISLGTVTLSKPLKNFLRKHKPHHIHLGPYSEVGDPFETNPVHIPSFEADFLQGILELWNTHNAEDQLNSCKKYSEDWQQFLAAQPLKSNELPEPFSSELAWMQQFFKSIDERFIIHLGNSMPVRYGSWSLPTAAQIFSNRGVSGIDGCLSTAVGSALAQPEKIVIAVLGDVTTVYDSNALWTDLPSNLRVVVFNNSGGRIFDWIEGPNKFPELRKFIHTPRKFDFKHLSKFYGVEHQSLGVDQIDLSFQKILFAETATLVELICKDDN